jgi:AraC-like DNA-binding protein
MRTTKHNITQRVRETLKDADLIRVRAPDIASQLAVSHPTMRRMLREAGTDYITLLNNERMDRLLTNPNEGSRDLGWRLGFSEYHSFFRWWKLVARHRGMAYNFSAHCREQQEIRA